MLVLSYISHKRRFGIDVGVLCPELVPAGLSLLRWVSLLGGIYIATLLGARYKDIKLRHPLYSHITPVIALLLFSKYPSFKNQMATFREQVQKAIDASVIPGVILQASDAKGSVTTPRI